MSTPKSSVDAFYQLGGSVHKETIFHGRKVVTLILHGKEHQFTVVGLGNDAEEVERMAMENGARLLINSVRQ